MTLGTLQVGRIAGVPIRIHASALLGMVVFTGFSLSPVRWVCFLGLILAHEVGHAVVVKAVGARALSIDITGYGGLCAWRGRVSATKRACIAWGGVWAQLVVLALALLAQQTVTEPGETLEQALFMLTSSNSWLIAVNLLPVTPLDGATAWELPLLLGRRVRTALRRKPLPDQLRQRDEAFDAGARRSEVSAMVSSLIDAAREDEP